jgi:hypothetical protein
MNVAFAIPWATIVCSHIGCVSRSGRDGSVPIALG